jgi:glutamate-1-semialdehyde 2,1-aminomutase
MVAGGGAVTSPELYTRACELMPGGVNSPVRAFQAVGGTPLYIERALGATITDVEGRTYIDYVNSWGASIHGHAYTPILAAISDAAARGTSYGAPHRGEIDLAEAVTARVPGLERVRFVNSGTEATLSAIRLARAATGRARIVKFAGNYHGAVDSLLAAAGSGVATLGLPDSAGVLPSATEDTAIAAFNDGQAVRELLAAEDVAAVLVEPVAGNMGLIPPVPGFLDDLRVACTETGTLLIFDEVMTGFRVGYGGAAGRYGVTPDLYCLRKVIGGGLPVGAYGGRRDLMEWIAPLGPVYQAGTLSGNPLAMAAGLAALSDLTPASYDQLEAMGARLEVGLKAILSAEAQVLRVGSMISVFFTPEAPSDFEGALRTDRGLFARWFHALLAEGVYLPPSALESWFLTLAHGRDEIDRTLAACEAAWQCVLRADGPN